jgi:hypothetical protein
MNGVFQEITNTTAGFIAAFVMLASLALCWVFATTANARLVERDQPAAKSFRWGYFYGMFGIVLYSLLILSNFALCIADLLMACDFTPRATYFLLFQTSLASVALIAHVMLLERSRIGFIIATFLSFNIVIYIINFFYIKNRWEELLPNKEE